MPAEPSLCPERERLLEDARRATDTVIDLLLRQRRALRGSGQLACLFDDDLGKAIGAKERAIGALCEHEKEHGCV